MNFFFGIKNENFNTRLTIPKFQNKNNKKNNFKIFQVSPESNKWKIEKFDNYHENDNFFFINQKDLDNHKFFFLAKDEEIKNFYNGNYAELKKLNNFTDTYPSFRSNIRVSIDGGGFSSYQSEYPFSMISKKGSIFSSTSLLTNMNADKNILFLRNVYKEPIIKEFFVYIINFKEKKVLRKEKIYTNKTNNLNLEKEFLKPNIYIFTDKYLCVPLYVSLNNQQISFEHTHPPHEYILSNDKFESVSKLKKKFYDIIN